MAELPELWFVVAVFLAAGLIKGVVGFGLPVFALSAFALTAPLPVAMALMLVPSFVTNVMQAGQGGSFKPLCRLLWPFLLLAFVGCVIGARWLMPGENTVLKALLGAVMLFYALISLSGWQWHIAPARRRHLGLYAGTANGIVTGLTGSFVVPGVLYLQAMNLDRTRLVQAMGILFLVSTTGLATGLGVQGFLDLWQGQTSAIGVIPAIIGMLIGQRIRKHMPEALFRRVFLLALLALGGTIFLRSVLG